MPHPIRSTQVYQRLNSVPGDRDTRKPEERRLALDLLRLVAALAVVLFHFGFRMGVTGEGGGAGFPELAPYAVFGTLGVSIFFAISGYVISASAEGRDAMSFAVARLARLWPAFLVCATVSFLILAMFGAPTFQPTVAQWLANFIMMPQLLGQPFVDGAYWSIVYELIFYGWVFLFLLARRFEGWIVEIAVVWLAISLLNQFGLHSEPLGRLFLTGYAPFFVVGMLTRELERKPRAFAATTLVAALALCLPMTIQQSGYLESEYGYHPADTATAAVVVASLLVFLLAVKVRLPARWVGPATLAGSLTYPLYLLHQNIGYVAFANLAAFTDHYVLLVGLVATLLGFAYLVHRFVERPGSRIIKVGAGRALSLLRRPRIPPELSGAT